MAGIDVSELFSDPDFVDPVTIIRRTETTGNNGRNTISEQEIDAFASVQSGNSDTLKRMPEGTQLSRMKTFYSKTPLGAAIDGGYPDIILWQGKRYQVINSIPWDNWGGGWYKADCVMEEPSV